MFTSKKKRVETTHKLKIATIYTMKDKYYQCTKRYKDTRYESLGDIQNEINT
jgi:hypothetical protein